VQCVTVDEESADWGEWGRIRKDRRIEVARMRCECERWRESKRKIEGVRRLEYIERGAGCGDGVILCGLD